PHTPKKRMRNGYQLSFSANWNWRASYAAVGWPAKHVAPAVGSQSWLTAPTLVRLSKLKASAIRSNRNRSPSAKRRETRRSQVKKPGSVNALRPKLPLQPAGGATPGTLKGERSFARQTLATPKVTAGMNGEVVVPPLPTEGRACDAPRSSRVSSP